MDDVSAKNQVEIPEDWWHIGLRDTPDEAFWRSPQVDDKSNKDTHAILQVTFILLGVIHFCITCEDMSYNYRPILTKHCSWYPSMTDNGVWHLIRDLALSMSDDSGIQLVITEWQEIVWSLHCINTGPRGCPKGQVTTNSAPQ